jgi:hypothetical protein
MSRDRAVGIATGWTAGVRFPTGTKIFLFSIASRLANLRPTQPPIQWVPGAHCREGGVKRPRREADHSAPSSAKVQNAGAIPPLPIGLYCVVRN